MADLIKRLRELEKEMTQKILTDEDAANIRILGGTAIGAIRAVEAAVLAKLAKQQEPIYQVWESTDSCNEFYSWNDSSEWQYNQAKEDNRRILFTTPQPQAERDNCTLVPTDKLKEMQAENKRLAEELGSAQMQLNNRSVSNMEASSAFALAAVTKQRDSFLAILMDYNKLTAADGWYADKVYAAIDSAKVKS